MKLLLGKEYRDDVKIKRSLNLNQDPFEPHLFLAVLLMAGNQYLEYSLHEWVKFRYVRDMYYIQLLN